MTQAPLHPQNRILPDRQPEERPLLSIMAVMAFLTGMTVLASLIGYRINRTWQSDLSSALTVQVFAEGSKAADPLDTARSIIARAAPRARVSIMSDEQGRALLEPWLGDSAFLADLPVPGLIRVDGASGLDLPTLQARLTENGIEAEIDDHNRWRDSIRTTWRIVNTAMLGVILVIFSASVFVASYATQSVLRARQNIIDVLSHVGARHGYVAKLFVARFLSLGLRGAGLGCVFAVIVLMVFVTVLRTFTHVDLPGLYPQPGDVIWLAGTGITLGLISAATAGWVTLSRLRRAHMLS
ncbi:MAG: hypothetical protein GDA39_07440 [Hyphomonadaceae bacterium]|nr:hypothetical protein [Hyphomonadaceae bacterium]